MMSFYEDDPRWLREAIASLTPLAPDLLVAVDGAYEAFPDGKNTSSPDRHAAILEAAIAHDMEVLLHVPTRTWVGSEVGKRSAMLDLALSRAKPDDWLCVFDTDYCLDCPIDARQIMDNTTIDAIEVGIFEGRLPDGTPSTYKLRMLMRATPGMKMADNHYTYVLPDGREHKILSKDSTVEALDMPELEVWHRKYERSAERLERQRVYYEKRDTRGMES